ncbi:ThiF family adenylyltransferase [Flavobacteriaceae bacterium M23B6Z8]
MKKHYRKTDKVMNRYLRQIQLGDFGLEKQQMLKNAKLLVVGAGGLGVPVLQYLAAMGVGTIGIVENDTVSLSNLQRQVIYTEEQASSETPKLNAIVKRLRALNSEVVYIPFDAYLNHENALSLISGFDLVIDCSDNFETRYLVNDACVILKKPFVYGALHGFEGHVSVFNYKGCATYRCLFPEIPGQDEIPNCDTNGVLGVIPGIIGSYQALEAVKLITDLGTSLAGKLMIYDGLEQEIRKIKIPLNPANLTIDIIKKPLKQLMCDQGEHSVTVEELMKALPSINKSFQLIDVRNTDEYKMFFVPGSYHIPLHQIKQRIQEIDIDKPVYVLCESGVRSTKAIQLLSTLNPELKLFNVEGGLAKFRKERMIFS